MDEELNKKVDELIDRLLSDEEYRNYFDCKFKQLLNVGHCYLDMDELKALEKE